MADFLNPNLDLITRAWAPMAETRDLKMDTPANHPVSLCSFFFQTANRQPLIPFLGRDVITIASSLGATAPRTARGAVPTWTRKAAAGRPRVGAWLCRALRC